MTDALRRLPEQLLGRVHTRVVHSRRVDVLARMLAGLIPADAHCLDVGSGDGLLARSIMDRRPDVRIEGIDVLARPDALIPVASFDGKSLPYGDASCEVVMVCDVLHHCEDPFALLQELCRVACARIIIKDHLREGLLAQTRLRLMDWVGNHRYGVALPYNYWRRAEWHEAFQSLGWAPQTWEEHVPLYPWPVSVFCGQSLHFVAALQRR
jgi:SAM-dependent methyltransferase